MSEELGWTIVGVAGIALLYLVANLIYQNAENNTKKAREIRVAKVEACRTISDEPLRTLCIIQGGLGADK